MFSNKKILLLSTLTIVMATQMTFGKIIYVDDDAAGANNGSSWENSYVYLQDALADATNSDKPVEIRVAQGIYTPDINNINIAFELVNGVTISGGYAGAIDPNARDIELYETILSGDLNGDDVPVSDPCDLFPETEEDSRYDNSYNVIIAINTDETAVLDGFIITGGIASDDNDNDVPQKNGGGLYCRQSSPAISNCTFSYNAAKEGGAMYCTNSSPTLINCRFDKNAAIIDDYGYGGSGGGVLNINSSPVLTDCTFTENYSYTGGGMYNLVNSQPVLTNCKFIGNTAYNNAGGGMNNYLCSPILTDCLFKSNSADLGGGLYNFISSPTLTGCTFIGNYAYSDGGGMANEDSEPILIECTFISNIASSGGAVFNDNCMDIVITNCTFTGNASYEGGAMCNWSGYFTITNSLFTGNASQISSAIHSYGCNLTLTNCTIAQNVMKHYTGYIPKDSNSTDGNIVRPSDIPDPNVPIPDNYPNPNQLELVNCIIRDEARSILNDVNSLINASYSNIQGGFDGEGNIDDDPLFANPGHWANVHDPNIVIDPNDPNAVWIDGDYHLKSQAGRFDPGSDNWVIDPVSSPCIDTGNPNSPVADEPQPNGGRINMGAYGGTPQASKSLLDESKKSLNLDEIAAIFSGFTRDGVMIFFLKSD